MADRGGTCFSLSHPHVCCGFADHMSSCTRACLCPPTPCWSCLRGFQCWCPATLAAPVLVTHPLPPAASCPGSRSAARALSPRHHRRRRRRRRAGLPHPPGHPRYPCRRPSRRLHFRPGARDRGSPPALATAPAMLSRIRRGLRCRRAAAAASTPAPCGPQAAGARATRYDT